MEGLTQVHVLPDQPGQVIGTRLLGLDRQGKLWCGVLLGEAGLTPTVRWTRVADERST